MQNIFGIIGWSGSGKTDLVCRLIKYFKSKNICVSSIKHSHHNFKIDKPGKDSFKHIVSGSNEVLIYNEKKWAMISSISSEKLLLKEMLKKFSKKTDLIILEGLKHIHFPKIEVIRSSIKKPPIYPNDKFVKALIYDKKKNLSNKIKLPAFSFSKTKQIGEFILDFLKNEKKK